MKKSVLLIIFCFYSLSVWADRCVLNTPNVVQSAVQQLQGLKRVIHYCPTCLNDNRVRYVDVSDLRILQEKHEQIIQIGNETLDLAYIYLPTNEIDVYHNLGYIVHCTDLKSSPVLEYLDAKKPYGIENVEYLLKGLHLCQQNACIEAIYQKILEDYFDTTSNTLRGFDFEQINLPKVISKTNVQELLRLISHYYGSEY